MKPSLEEIATEKTDVKVIRINADENMELCKQLNVTALPVLMYYNTQKLSWRKDGFQSKEELLKGLN
jgi:thioredoxin-like negative regulator of GroEL